MKKSLFLGILIISSLSLVASSAGQRSASPTTVTDVSELSRQIAEEISFDAWCDRRMASAQASQDLIKNAIGAALADFASDLKETDVQEHKTVTVRLRNNESDCLKGIFAKLDELTPGCQTTIFPGWVCKVDSKSQLKLQITPLYRSRQLNE